MSDNLPEACNQNSVFKKGNMIRHSATFDLDLAIINVEYETKEYIKLKILYFNRNYNQLIDYKPDVVKIKASEKSKWSFVRKHVY